MRWGQISTREILNCMDNQTYHRGSHRGARSKPRSLKLLESLIMSTEISIGLLVYIDINSPVYQIVRSFHRVPYAGCAGTYWYKQIYGDDVSYIDVSSHKFYA